MQKGKNKIKDVFTKKIFRRVFGVSMVSSIGLAFADVADAVVVGQKMGATGLAAISLSLPIYQIMNICMHGLGIGGSVKFSRLMGEGKKDEAVANFNRVLQVAALVGVLLALLGNVFIEPLLSVLGTNPSDGELFVATQNYVRILVTGIPTFLFAYIINYYLRNDGNEALASIGFTIANVVDIILNVVFVFVFQMGTTGAAISTVIGQIIAILIYLPGVTGKRGNLRFCMVRPNGHEVFRYFRIGFSTSVQYMYQMIFILIVNNVLANISGENGIAVFDMLQNVSYLIIYIFEGAVKAMQPLLSTYNGEHNEEGKKETFKLALRYSYVFAGTVILFLMLFPGAFCTLLGVNEGSVALLGRMAIRIYGIGVVFAGFSILLESYYQSCEIEKNAFVLATLRGSVILIPCTILFSMMGINVFWWLFPTVEVSCLLVFFIWKHFFGKSSSQLEKDRIFEETILNNNTELGNLIEKVEAFCEKWEADVKQTYFVTMSVEEICASIMHKAFGKNVEGTIQITLIALQDGKFELHMRDNAESFNPFSLHAKKAEVEEEFDSNAMGMTMIKNKAKFFFYRQYQGYNTLIVKI